MFSNRRLTAGVILVANLLTFSAFGDTSVSSTPAKGAVIQDRIELAPGPGVFFMDYKVGSDHAYSRFRYCDDPQTALSCRWVGSADFMENGTLRDARTFLDAKIPKNGSLANQPFARWAALQQHWIFANVMGLTDAKNADQRELESIRASVAGADDSVFQAHGLAAQGITKERVLNWLDHPNYYQGFSRALNREVPSDQAVLAEIRNAHTMGQSAVPAAPSAQPHAEQASAPSAEKPRPGTYSAQQAL